MQKKTNYLATSTTSKIEYRKTFPFIPYIVS